MSYSTGNGSGGSVAGSSDVSLSNPLQGHYLGYDAGLAKWQNFPRPAVLQETVFTNSATGSAETINDVTAYTISVLTLTANCTFTFPTAAAGKSFMLVLKQDATGSRTATWPGNVKWPGGTAPTLTTTASKADVISFICADGANWYGFVGGLAF